MPNAEMLISKITLTDASGAVKDITSTKAFYMPIGNVTVNVEFKVKTYTITFISNGEVIDTKEHVLGDAITPPDIPASFEKDGFFYAFIGWDKPLSVVTEDQTYTARYNKILSELKTEASTESASQKVVKSHLVPIAIVGVVVLTSLGGFTTVVISFIRKTKKSKK